jgi:hypothetical protein
VKRSQSRVAVRAKNQILILFLGDVEKTFNVLCRVRSACRLENFSAWIAFA